VGQKLFGPQKLKSENFMADKKKSQKKRAESDAILDNIKWRL